MNIPQEHRSGIKPPFCLGTSSNNHKEVPAPAGRDKSSYFSNFIYYNYRARNAVVRSASRVHVVEVEDASGG